jgi:hypothetical protein
VSGPEPLVAAAVVAVRRSPHSGPRRHQVRVPPSGLGNESSFEKR